jgi:hypothetical protein
VANIDELKAILGRLKSRTATEADQRALKAAKESGAIRIEAGSRGVAIGGHADRATIITGDGNVILNVNGSDAEFLFQALNSSRGPKSKERVIPFDLPYLCNRIDQENELHDALGRHLEGKQRDRPFVCVIHGDESECTDAFLQRLNDTYLPTMFSSHIEAHLLQWPKPRNDQPEAIAGSLDQLAISVRRVFHDLKDRTAPVVIATHISTDWCDPLGKELIQTYFSFWNTYPAIGRLLINCLCVTYVRGEWWNALRRKRLRSLNRDIKASFDSLNGHTNIGKVLLTELPPIVQDEAAGWARLDPVRSIWNDDIELLILQIKRLYRRRFVFAQRPIPMQVLAPKLRNIVMAQTQ